MVLNVPCAKQEKFHMGLSRLEMGDVEVEVMN